MSEFYVNRSKSEIFKVVFNRLCCHGNYENVTSYISIKIFRQYIVTCQVSACELQPFYCHYLANDIYSQTAQTVFNHLKGLILMHVSEDDGYRQKLKGVFTYTFHFSCRNPVISKKEAITARKDKVFRQLPPALSGSGYQREWESMYYYHYLPCPVGTFMNSSTKYVLRTCTPCPPGKTGLSLSPAHVNVDF